MTKTKLTGAQYKAIREMAASVSGYDSTSPIWGMKLAEVLALIEVDIDNGSLAEAHNLIAELRKRLLKSELMAH